MNIISRLNALVARDPIKIILAGHAEHAEVLTLRHTSQASEIHQSLMGAIWRTVDIESTLDTMDWRESWDEMVGLRAKYRGMIEDLVADWYHDRQWYKLMQEDGIVR